MTYMLDTNICIYIVKQKPISVLQKFSQLAVGDVSMSLVTYGELVFGAKKSQNAVKALQTLEELTAFIPVLPMHTKAARLYAQTRFTLQQKGLPIGNNDLWIAAHALAEDKILVSNNLREFSRVQGLKTENWV